MTVKFSNLHAGRALFHRKISDRDLVDPRTTLQLDGLQKLKRKMTSGLEPAFFRLVS
jgi:hypothetical protein